MKLQDYEDELAVYAVEVTKWLISRGVRADEAQDTLQDVFIKMLESDLLIPPSKLRSWMYRVALRSYIDKYRRNAKYQEILYELQHELKELTEEAPDLKPFLERLKTVDKKILLQFYYEKRSVKEIAVLTGFSQSKIKVQLYRARKKLRKILESDGLDEWSI